MPEGIIDVAAVAAAVRQLDGERADTVMGGAYIDGAFHTTADLLDTATNRIARMTRGVLDPRKITKRDVAAILAAYGLGSDAIKTHAAAIAGRLHREYGYMTTTARR